MNTQAQANVPAASLVANNSAPTNDAVLSYGLEAVKDWQRGQKALGTGDQRAIYALAHAWDEVTFVAVINGKKPGEIEEQFSFDLLDYCTKPLTNENGTRNNKATNARTLAICSRVFGLEPKQVDQAIKQRITRALEVVQHIMASGYAATDIEISKGGRISVPFNLLNDEPKEDASTNDKKHYSNMQGETVELDGKKGNTVAELQRRARPKPVKSAQAANADKGADFAASVDFITVTLQHLLDEKTGKDMPAPNKAMRKKLFDLSTVVGAYFTADPVEENEFKEEQPKKKNTRASKG